jgi:hypothetical protein
VTIGPSGVTGGNTLLGAGADESGVEGGAGGADVDSPPASKGLGPVLCSAHDVSRNAAAAKANHRALCLLMRQYSPSVVSRPGPIAPRFY